MGFLGRFQWWRPDWPPPQPFLVSLDAAVALQKLHISGTLISGRFDLLEQAQAPTNISQYAKERAELNRDRYVHLLLDRFQDVEIQVFDIHPYEGVRRWKEVQAKFQGIRA